MAHLLGAEGLSLDFPTKRVFDNLTKFIVWIIPTNLGESLLVLTAVSLALPLPVLTPTYVGPANATGYLPPVMGN